jgi:hypothetical protein
MLSAAEHDDWLVPGAPHDHAYLRINRLLNLYSSCDPVLKRYRFLDTCTRPEAMGFVGVAGRSRLLDGGARLDEFDVCCTLGITHDADAYFGSHFLVRKMQRYVFWEPIAD